MSTAGLRLRPAGQTGFSLIELMVASSIGVFLIGGILTVYSSGSSNFQLNQNIAKLQDNARVALEIIAPDLRLAGYWALSPGAEGVAGRTGDTVTPMAAGFTPANDCYVGFYSNLEAGLEYANETETGVANPFNTCLPDSERQAGTDIVVIRRAATAQTGAAQLVPGRLYLASNRLGGALFVGGQPFPSGYTAADSLNEVLTYLYYVAPSSSTDASLPSLRRKVVSDGPEIVDEELVPGVEDFQIQLGIDADSDGAVDSYLSPANPALVGATVVSARLWVLTRNEGYEEAFIDTATYTYSDVSVTPADNRRRLMLSKTIHLRNGRSSL